MYDLDDLIYVASRALSVLVRPALLFWIMYLGLENESIDFALILTVFTSVTYILAIEVHKEYYKEVFKNSSEQINHIAKNRSFFAYLNGIFRMAILGFVIGLVAWMLLKGEVLLSILLGLIIALDYFVVEYMRFLIFEKRFKTWSIIQIIRYVVPGVIVFLTVPILTNQAILIFLISYLTCLILLVTQISRKINILRLYKGKSLKISELGLNKIFWQFKERFFYVLAAFCNRHTLLIDRYVVYFLDHVYFTFYTLLSLVVSVVPMFVDMFYISRNRARFAINIIPLSKLMTEKTLLLSMLSSLVIALMASVTIIILQNQPFMESLNILIILLICFAVHSIASPIYEMTFWHCSLNKRLRIELAYCLSIILSGLLIWFSSLHIFIFLMIMLSIHIIRLFLLRKYLLLGISPAL